jgi:hypothetical protein
MLYVQGQHGFGDCIHARAVIRQLLKAGKQITLETSWPSLYHDLVGDNFKLARRGKVGLHSQDKNSQRESDKFSAMRFGVGMQAMRVAYSGQQVLRSPSKTVLEAMCNATGTSYEEADYRIPVPDSWVELLFATLGGLPKSTSEKPWLIYRPLVARPEWRGSILRNADPASYYTLFGEIRDRYFVISIADLEAGKEWLAYPEQEIKADLTFHHGELVCEALVALFKQSDLVFTSSGFPAILAPAVGTPCISIVGGYEYPGCHDSAARFAPYLSIGPRTSCSCWTSTCRQVCDKSFDLTVARAKIDKFLSKTVIQISYPQVGVERTQIGAVA